MVIKTQIRPNHALQTQRYPIHTQSEREREINLGAAVKGIGATKPSVQIFFAQTTHLLIPQLIHDVPIIQGQFDLPDEIRRRCPAEGLVQPRQLADLGRIQPGKDQRDAVLGYVLEPGLRRRVARPVPLRNRKRRGTTTHQRQRHRERERLTD